jgi:hypothetical protein
MMPKVYRRRPSDDVYSGNITHTMYFFYGDAGVYQVSELTI